MCNKLEFLFLVFFQPLKAGTEHSRAVGCAKAGGRWIWLTGYYCWPLSCELGEKCRLSNAVDFLLENWNSLTDVFHGCRGHHVLADHFWRKQTQ